MPMTNEQEARRELLLIALERCEDPGNSCFTWPVNKAQASRNFFTATGSMADLGVKLERSPVRKQVGEHEQRWPPGKALILWVGLSLVLWGLIIGGLILLF